MTDEQIKATEEFLHYVEMHGPIVKFYNMLMLLSALMTLISIAVLILLGKILGFVIPIIGIVVGIGFFVLAAILKKKRNAQKLADNIRPMKGVLIGSTIDTNTNIETWNVTVDGMSVSIPFEYRYKTKSGIKINHKMARGRECYIVMYDGLKYNDEKALVVF